MVLCAAVACQKERATTEEQLLAELTPKAVAVDIAAIKVPALFAHIPADAPYVFGAFEAVPADYLAKLQQSFGPVMSRIVSEAPGWQEDPLAKAFLDEIGGKLDAKGLESLGLATPPRFVIYGIGVAPFVVRVEIKDEQILRTAIERFAQKIGKPLAAPEQRDGKSFWRHVKDRTTAIIAIVDRQVVLAVGETADIDANLGLILGVEKPQRSMADGKPLLDAMAKHGFGPHLIGYADTRKIAAGVFAKLAQRTPAIPPECAAEVDRIAARIPRIVIGTSEISAKRLAGGYVFELEPGLLADVAALKTEVPGLGAALSGQVTFAVGAGIDLAKGAALAGRAFSALAEVAAACGSMTGAEKMAALAGKLARELPEPITKITGGVIAVHAFSLSPRGTPEHVDGFGMITSASAKQLIASLEQQPGFSELGLEVNGKLNKLPVPKGVLPFDMYAGVGERALVVATGDKGRTAAEQGRRAAGGGKVPLLAMVMDYGSFFATAMKMTPAGADAGTVELMKAMSALFGRATLTIDASDKGVALWSSVELK